MIGLNVQITNTTHRVTDAADKASFKNVGHAAASIRNAAIASIIPSDEPSAPGSPPHTRKRITRKGKQLKGQLQRAIVFHHDRATNTAVIGPRHSVVGESGAAHEFGEEFKGDSFVQRPYMGPALDKNLGRFADDFQGAIGGH